MNRSIAALHSRQFDVLVIGGGIYGAFIALDATLRGLSVALIDKSDFASATSANSMKIIHSGLRQLQYADLSLMRASMRERAILSQIAPRLVRTLPVVVPTYRHSARSKWAFSLAFMVRRLIGADLTRLNAAVPGASSDRVISRLECLRRLPGIPSENLTGAALFHDSQIDNTERMVLAILREAERRGAYVLNYAEANGFLGDRAQITGVRVRDLVTEARVDVRARMVVNACGPWADEILSLIGDGRHQIGIRFAKALNLITKPLFEGSAVGVDADNGSLSAQPLIRNGRRLIYVTPWRGRSLIGTFYSPFDGSPDAVKATQNEVQRCLENVNDSLPGAQLSSKEVTFVHAGLVPIVDAKRSNGDIQLARRHIIRDHRRDGLAGLISVVGTQYTMARLVAEKLVDQVFRAWGSRAPKSSTAFTAVAGGHDQERPELPHRTVEGQPEWEANPRLLREEVVRAVRDEHAVRLSDVVFRRTELGSAGHPGNEPLRISAEVMAEELGWDRDRMEFELDRVASGFPNGSGGQ